MFDTYQLRRETHEHNHRTTIEEKRAPTDESVKLLKEMEQAAHDKLLGSVRLEGCEVDCVVHAMRASAALGPGEFKFAVQYRLGAKRREVRHDFRMKFGEDEHESRQRMAQELLKAVSEDMARQILAPAFGAAMKQLGGRLL